MADIKEIVKVAVDAYKGNVEKYSVAQSQAALREALIEANNGSTTLNYKDIRDGKCSGVFTIIEEILSNTVAEGLTEDMFFNTLVDSRNLALGDKNKFIVDDDVLFTVADTAEGTQAVRRQRLGGAREIEIPTTLKTVRIYEELNRVLAGRVDFNDMIRRVGESFKRQILNDIYSVWANMTAAEMGGVTYFPTAGAYSEAALLELIAHVEAAADGKQAMIIGTKKALRNLSANMTPAYIGETVKNDMYNAGFLGTFFGSPVLAVPQRHQVGNTNFILDDNMITVIATDEKPIKLVNEGDSLIITGDPFNNMDLTQEYFAAQRWGLGIVMPNNHGIGRYEIA